MTPPRGLPSPPHKVLRRRSKIYLNSPLKWVHTPKVLTISQEAFSMTRLFLSIGTALLLTVGTVWAGPLEDATAANKRGDYATALKTFQSLAAQGNAEAQTNLGMEELKVLGTICHISYLTHRPRNRRRPRSGFGTIPADRE